MQSFDENERKYLLELAKDYPARDEVFGEIINLNAILSLPKGTEHFLSDIHGEYEAYSHIRRNASGVIKRKVDLLFSDTLSDDERAELATLIYYPEEKLDEIKEKYTDLADRYDGIIVRLLELTRLVSSKYTRSKVRKQLKKTAGAFDYIIEELLNNDYDETNKGKYYSNIIKTVIRTGTADSFIIALSSAIKSLVIDHLHIVGDVFDRGARADIVIDELMKEGSLDIQWGNHDVLWLGAASGSRVCIATALHNSIAYKNLDVVEIGYGISLRPLALYADELYKGTDVSLYMPKGESGGDLLQHDDDSLIARMHKVISIIQFKLEGIAIKKHPEYRMNDRLLLERIDYDRGVIDIGGVEYPLKDSYFPTVNRENPYELTERETEVMKYLKTAFMRSERLQRHARFLFERGGMYTVFNRNLLFHGCIPLDSDGELMHLEAACGRSGKDLMDYCDSMARCGYFSPEGSEKRQNGKDFLWFLWCGKNSPLCARERITTFERLYIADEATWDEPRNAYYRCWQDEQIVEGILKEFSLGGSRSHIINGHIPVKKGEEPIKAGGKLILIDGGFCRAFHSRTGIGGYTLIYNAEGMRISAHEPFTGKENAIKNNRDIISETVVFEHSDDKIRVRDTDIGREITDKIADLMLLARAYEDGVVKEKVRSNSEE